MLTVTALDAFYGDFQALFGLTFQVSAGEVVSVVGANGAGKSTLLKAVAGLVPARPDQIELEGSPIGGKGADLIARMGVVLVPEGRRIFPSLSVEENLLMGSYAGRTGPWNLPRVYSLFPALGSRRRIGATELSGGEQQMLAIGRGLMANPRLLMLDEVSLGLAPIVIREIYAAMPAVLAEGTTVILVEQDVRQAIAVADRIYCLQAGRVALHGPADDLDHDTLVAAYFGMEL